MRHVSLFPSRGRWCAVVVLALSVGVFCPLGWGEPTRPGAHEHEIARTVCSILKKDHLTRHPFDEEIAGRCLTQLFAMFDPLKVYFYQSDVDRFMARKKEVEKTREGNVSLAFEIFGTLVKRVDERVKLADELLAMPHDFSLDEEVVSDRKALQHPKDEREARERWRKRIKYDLLMLRADRLDEEKSAKPKPEQEGAPPAEKPEKKSAAEQAQEDVKRLSNRYHRIAKRWHQTQNDELLELYLSALCSSYDPHSSYMSADTVDDFNIMMSLELEGVGAELKTTDGETIINRLVPDGAAEKDGRLKPGDKIVGVGQGNEGPIQDVVEMKLRDVVKLIRGRRGTVVRLEVVSPRGKERKVIQITRAKVELKDGEARSKVFEAGRKPDGKPYRIGVIDLPSFYMDMAGARAGLSNFKSTTRDVRAILQDFNREAVDAVVLDLRRNGGGALQEAINLTGLFLHEGPIVQVKDSNGRVTPYNDPDSGILWKGPLVVLVSRLSASASEILAGAIQDYHRGLIVGDHATHGKGTVQSLTDLSEAMFDTRYGDKMGSLKITMQQFYRPSGESTQLRGALADVELPSRFSLFDVGEADLDYAVPFDRIEPDSFRPFNLASKPIAERLSQLSTERRAKSAEFQQLLRRIARAEEQKKRKKVTLNERKYLAERAEWNAEKDEEKMLEEISETRKTEIKQDYYLNEVLAIAADYLHLLSADGSRTLHAVQASKAAGKDN